MGLCTLGGCAVPAAFVIAGAAFTIGLELLEAFRVSAGGEPVLQAAAIDLQFPSQPADRPAGASFNLDAQSIQAVPLDVAKVRTLEQGGSGQATIDVRVAAATEANPCTNGTAAGQFTIGFNGVNVNVQKGSFELPSQAFEFVNSGKFTLCLGVSASVDASIKINNIGVTFGQDESTCPANGKCDTDAVSCVDSYCPFGLLCNSDNKCVPTNCYGGVGGTCPNFLSCNEAGVCELFDCQIDSANICALLGQQCNNASGKCEPYPCIDSECHFGTGCDAFNQCVPIWCSGTSVPCPSSLVCEQGICVERRCDTDANCPLFLHCDNGLCRPNECQPDSVCPGGVEVCNGFGQCVPPKCVNSECPFNLKCDEFGQCVPIACTDDLVNPCPVLLHCNRSLGICVERECGQPEQDSCPTTMRCSEDGRCLPKECTPGSGGCPPGQQCSGLGECIQVPCIDSQCPFGLVCTDLGGECIAPACRVRPPYCPAPLSCDESLQLCVPRECGPHIPSCEPNGLVCDESLGFCVTEQCSSGSKCEVECIDDSECQTGETCDNGACVSSGGNCIPGVNCDTECDGDSDCPAGLACNDAHFCYDPSNIECFFDSDCPQGQSCDARFQCN